jgi:hypothetical protein
VKDQSSHSAANYASTLCFILSDGVKSKKKDTTVKQFIIFVFTQLLPFRLLQVSDRSAVEEASESQLFQAGATTGLILSLEFIFQYTHHTVTYTATQISECIL